MDFPNLQIENKDQEIDQFSFDDFKIIGYDNPHSYIKAPIAV